MSMQFTIHRKDPASQARAGVLETDHGPVRTPIFMPVGTAATVKGIYHRDVRDEAQAQIILANTYHLYLRPGMEIIEQAGGVHRFSTWEGPMLTDSGGFQVFSLAACRKLKEEGCHFRSHIDGSKHLFTPESVIDTERTSGADIMMAFDECPPGDAPRDYAAKSLALTAASSAMRRRPPNTVITKRSSPSFRGAPTPTCGHRPPRTSSSTMPTAMPSAVSPSASLPR